MCHVRTLCVGGGAVLLAMLSAVHLCDFAVAVDDGSSFAECDRLSGLALSNGLCFLVWLVRLFQIKKRAAEGKWWPCDCARVHALRLG